MLKYVDTKVVFQEIPDEIVLAINISGCPIKCPDCHSKYLWEDVGEPLTKESLDKLIKDNKGITCISFMGGDANSGNIMTLARYIRENYDFKIAWYSGKDDFYKFTDLAFFDYIKLGPYIKELGPLNADTTNQVLYKIRPVKLWDTYYILENITYKLWKKKKLG